MQEKVKHGKKENWWGEGEEERRETGQYKVISREESTVPTSGFKKSQGLAKQFSP